jgi:hypothetical protein
MSTLEERGLALSALLASGRPDITVLRPGDDACPHDLVVQATISGGVYTTAVIHYTCQRCRLKVEVPDVR